MNFPVTASTLSDIYLGKFIQQKYALPENATCRLFRTGINHTYIINANEADYVFRVYSYTWRTPQEIQDELDLLLLLHNEGISVSYPVPDNNGALIQELNAPEGMRYGVLFTFAKGDKVRFKSADTCRLIGQLMAKMHRVTQGKTNSRITYNYQTLIDSPYNLASQYFDKTLPEMQYISELTLSLKEAITQAAATATGIVHMDIWYDNMAIENDTRITLFDFDFCGNGPLLLDVAYFCNQLFNIETDKQIYEQKVSSFINGYRQIRNLRYKELQLIPLLAPAVFIFYLGVQCSRFDWSNIFLSENYLKMYIGRIQAWTEYYSNKNNILL